MKRRRISSCGLWLALAVICPGLASANAQESREESNSQAGQQSDSQAEYDDPDIPELLASPVIDEAPLGGEAEAARPGPGSAITLELDSDEQARLAQFMAGRSLTQWDNLLLFADDLRLGYRGPFARLLMRQDAASGDAMLDMLGRLTEGQRRYMAQALASREPWEWEIIPRYLAAAPVEEALAAIYDPDASDNADTEVEWPQPLENSLAAQFARVMSVQTTRRVSHRHARATAELAPWQAQILVSDRSAFTPLELSKEISTYGKPLADFQRWHTCGAVLVEPDWVLTAAHCIVTPPGTSYLNRRNVRTGTLDIISGGTIWRIDKVVRHGGYTPGTMANDIALLHITGGQPRKNAKNFDPRAIRPAGPGDPPPRGGERVLLTGWGATGEAERSRDMRGLARTGLVADSLLNMAWLNVYPQSRCNTNVHYREQKLKLIDGQLCAGADGKTSTCTGDSGGPLVWTNPKRRDAQGQQERVLIGLVSFAPGCGHEDTPSAFVDVRYFADWIRDAKQHARAGEVVDWQRER